MRKLYKNKDLIRIGFYGGLSIKAVYALLEFINGVLLMILNHEQLNTLIWLIAFPELREDPKDIVMNYFIKLGQILSISMQHSVAIYLLLHGATKIAVIWLLLKKKLWAYPLAVGVFGIFIIYEIYSYIHSLSALLLLLIFMDILVIVMIILEYKRFKMEE